MEDEYEWCSYMATQVQHGIGSPNSERWPTLQENGYEEGGICRTSEPPPFGDDISHKMLILNLSIDDQLEVYGGAYDGPQPLTSQLRSLVEQIRLLVAEHKQQETNQFTPDSGSNLVFPDARSRSIVGHGSFTPLNENFDGRAGRGPPDCPPDPKQPNGPALKQVQKRQASPDGPEYPHEVAGEDSQMPTEPSLRNDDADDEDGDSEAYKKENLRTIRFSDSKSLRGFYEACFRRIQQTACRQIAQAFVKVVHPRKQTMFPYNANSGNKKGGNSKSETPEKKPAWWPETIPHREPAHMKTPDRMNLLLHILCDLWNVPGVGPDKVGIRVQHLQKATDQDQTIRKLGKRVLHWLREIYLARAAEEQVMEGTTRECVTLHWPSGKRMKKKTEPRRTKVDDDRGDDSIIRFEDQHTSTPQVVDVEFVPVRRDGQPYPENDSASERENELSWRRFCAPLLRDEAVDFEVPDPQDHFQSRPNDAGQEVPAQPGSHFNPEPVGSFVAEQPLVTTVDTMPSTQAVQNQHAGVGLPTLPPTFSLPPRLPPVAAIPYRTNISPWDAQQDQQDLNAQIDVGHSQRLNRLSLDSASISGYRTEREPAASLDMSRRLPSQPVPPYDAAHGVYRPEPTRPNSWMNGVTLPAMLPPIVSEPPTTHATGLSRDGVRLSLQGPEFRQLPPFHLTPSLRLERDGGEFKIGNPDSNYVPISNRVDQPEQHTMHDGAYGFHTSRTESMDYEA